MTADLLEIARMIAHEAAEVAVRRRREGVRVAATKSTTTDVVTAVDREVEALIRGRLAERRPGDGFLGEESGAERGSTGLTWVVDPIDGTVNYLYGIPHYAVSIAVVEGEPDPQTWTALAGCVVNPGLGETFTATAGGGAELDGEPIRVAEPVALDQTMVATGFGYDPEIRAQQGELVARLLPQVRDIRRLGTASLDLCAIGCGRVDAFYERGLNAWDQAAGALIAREAGALVAGIDDREPDVDFIVAGHPDVAVRLLSALEAAGLRDQL